MKSIAKNSASTVRRSLLPIAAACIAFPSGAFAQGASAPDGAETTDYRPKKYSASRYRTTYDNSAFEREILPPQKEETKVEVTPFKFSLVSASGRDGRYRIVVVDSKGKYQVITDTPDEDGFHYSSIEPAAKIQDFKVSVTKGTQTEVVEFDNKRFSIASKKIAPPKPTNRTPRPNVVPTNRKPAPTRAPAPTSKSGSTPAKKPGSSALSTLEKSAAAAKGTSTTATESKGKVPGRRVVLPPKNR